MSPKMALAACLMLGCGRIDSAVPSASTKDAAPAWEAAAPDGNASCLPPPVVPTSTPEIAATLVSGTTIDAWGHSALGFFWTVHPNTTACPFALWQLEAGAVQPDTVEAPCGELMAVGQDVLYLSDWGDAGTLQIQVDVPVGGVAKTVGTIGKDFGIANFVAGRLVVFKSTQVFTEPLPFGTPQPLCDFPAGTDLSFPSMSDAADLYVAAAPHQESAAQLYAVAIPSGAKREVAVLNQEPFFVGGGYVYQNEVAGGIAQIDTTTGEKRLVVPGVPSTQVTDGGYVTVAAADERYLYYLDVGPLSDLYRYRHCGGPPQLVVGQVFVDFTLQQDARYLYWTAGPAIIRLEKPL